MGNVPFCTGMNYCLMNVSDNGIEILVQTGHCYVIFLPIILIVELVRIFENK